MEYQHKNSKQFGLEQRQHDFQDRIKEQLSNEDGKIFAQPSFFHIQQEEDRQNSEFKRTRSTCHNNTNSSLSIKFLSRQQGKIALSPLSKMPRQNRWSLGNCGFGILLPKRKPLEENSTYLKARLRELLKNEQVETQISEDTSYPSLLIKHQQTSQGRSHMSSHFHPPSHTKIQNKTVCLMLNVATPKNRSINLLTNKEILKTKLSDKFPKIDKKLTRKKLKKCDKVPFISSMVDKNLRTRFQNPDRQKGELYLEPVNSSDRKPMLPYVLTVENLNPLNKTSSHDDRYATKQAFCIDSEKHSNYDILLDFAKRIKFK